MFNIYNEIIEFSVRTTVLSPCHNSCTVALSKQLYCRPIRRAVLSPCHNSYTVALSQELHCRPVTKALLPPCQNSCIVALSEQLYCRSVTTAVLSPCHNTSTAALSEQLYCHPHTNGFTSVLLCVIVYPAIGVVLFKLHLSLPTAIMFLFDWTVSEILWRVYLISNCVKFFS
jgi:hypothetical protein